MKSIKVIFSLLLLAFMAACIDRSSPSEIALASSEAWFNGDIDEYFEYIDVTEEEKSNLEGFYRVKAGDLLEKYKDKGGVDKIKVINEYINDDGTDCTVTVEVTFEDGSTEESRINLDNIDGDWYVENPMAK